MKLSVFYIILIAFTWANYSLHLDQSLDNMLQAHILDVGQGLGVLIEYEGYTILIDTGPDDGIINELGSVLPSFHNNIDVVVITHPHNDHYMGLFHVLGFYHPQIIILSKLIASNYTYALLFTLLEPDHPPFLVPDTTHITIEDMLITMYQLPPPYNNRNNASIVTLVEFGGHTLLITGDLEADFEAILLSTYDLPPIEHYVAGHHGSNTSSSTPFLETIRPQNTYISAGEDNSFGHPSPETITSLMEVESIIHETKDSGSMTIICPKGSPCIQDFAH